MWFGSALWSCAVISQENLCLIQIFPCVWTAYIRCCDVFVGLSKVLLDHPEGRGKFMSIRRGWMVNCAPFLRACMCVHACMCACVCVCSAFISKGWLFARGQVLSAVLLPFSVSVCGDSQGGSSCSYTQGRTVGSVGTRRREMPHSLTLTHSLHLCKAPRVLLLVCQVQFAEPSEPSQALHLTVLFGGVADSIMVTIYQRVFVLVPALRVTVIPRFGK